MFILPFFVLPPVPPQVSLEVEPGTPFINPETVANSGLPISSDKPSPNSKGTPIRHGNPKILSANSVQPLSKEPPPVKTTPALIFPFNPDWRSSLS